MKTVTIRYREKIGEQILGVNTSIDLELVESSYNNLQRSTSYIINDIYAEMMEKFEKDPLVIKLRNETSSH